MALKTIFFAFIVLNKLSVDKWAQNPHKKLFTAIYNETPEIIFSCDKSNM